MTASVVHQARAMLDLLNRYSWKAFAVVTGAPTADSEYFIDTLRNLVETHYTQDWSVATTSSELGKRRSEVLPQPRGS